MNAELFCLVGKPNRLKQEFVSQLKEKLTYEPSIIVPEVYTTDEAVAEGDNYKHLDERDFNLRASMGMYSLGWEKNAHQFGISADIIQRLNTGVDVVVNGSLHNLEQATRLFPNINTVIIKKQGCGSRSDFSKINEHQYLIAENEDVKLEWSDADDMGHPYILTLMSEDDIEKAIEMLLSLISYERNYLDKVV